ncbi:S-2-hydroxy-acid oxidase [Aspergillus insuetus]
MTPLSISEIQAAAKDKLPKHIYDFYASGSDNEKALARNRSGFDRLFIQPRVLRNVSSVDTSTTIFGWQSPLPIGLAPSAMQKLAGGDGELDTARAAARHGVSMTLSSQSTVSLEEVTQVRDDQQHSGAAAPPPPPFWMQIYLYEDVEKSLKLIRRAEAAGYQALVLTVDTPVLGNRLNERKTPLVLPRGMHLPNLDSPLLPDAEEPEPEPQPSINRQLMNAASAAEAQALRTRYGHRMHSASLTWSRTIKFLRDATRMRIILKGIMTGADAALAVQHGVDAIIVSNHGGRQLDATCATIEALPGIVAAVRRAIPVILDGGIQTGADVFKALALGAEFVLVGRPVLWGLAYQGNKGVEAAINILERELSRTMALAGVVKISEITKETLGIIPADGFGVTKL